MNILSSSYRPRPCSVVNQAEVIGSSRRLFRGRAVLTPGGRGGRCRWLKKALEALGGVGFGAPKRCALGTQYITVHAMREKRNIKSRNENNIL